MNMVIYLNASLPIGSRENKFCLFHISILFIKLMVRNGCGEMTILVPLKEQISYFQYYN